VRLMTIALAAWGLGCLPCAPAMAGPSQGGNCVLYVREVTGVDLSGNAGMWWQHAEGRYLRGHEPAAGAILVFKPYAGMRSGHVAVVSRVVGPREILVDQANWIRGRVVKSMSVIDASPGNDWSSVKVVELHSGTHGRENPTFGFIYPRPVRNDFDETIAAAAADHPRAIRVALNSTPLAASDQSRRAQKAALIAVALSSPRPKVPARFIEAAADESLDSTIAHGPGRSPSDEMLLAD